MRAHANLHHKYDLPKSIAVVVQIYVDLERLAADLVTAEAIPKVTDLYSFVKAMNSQPHISIIDCEHATVQEKVKTAYEIHLENCHCQHVVLGLGPSSEYYGVLEEYADDEYTMLKTSLIKPGGGLPGEYDLPFHIAKLSAMHDVPLIPQFGDAVSDLQPAPLLASSPAAPSSRQRSYDTRPAHVTLANIAESAPNTSTLPGPYSDNEHKVSSQSGSVHSSPSSHTSFAEREQDVAKHVANATSFPWSGPHGQNASDSPSRQHDWEVSLPAKVPSNRWTDQHEDNPDDYPPLPSARNPSYVHHVSDAGRHPGASRSARTIGRRRRPASPSPDRSGTSHHSITSAALPPVPHLPDIPLRNDIIRNKHGERLDLPLPRPTTSDHQAFAARSRRRKLCNRYHLTGKCTTFTCQFDHASISSEILLVLLHKARERPCLSGSYCDDHGCPEGHFCPIREHGNGHGTPRHGAYGACAFNRARLQVTDFEPDESKTIRAQKADAELARSQAQRRAHTQAADGW